MKAWQQAAFVIAGLLGVVVAPVLMAIGVMPDAAIGIAVAAIIAIVVAYCLMHRRRTGRYPWQGPKW